MRILKLLILLLPSIILAKEVLIKDVLDREVKLSLPAKRIVLGFYYTDYLAVGGKESFDRVVGFVKDAWAVYAKNSYEFYKTLIPRLENLEDVGDPQFGTFSSEKLLALKPDLVLLADWQYELLKDEVALFERQNIPVLVISYNQESLKQHSLSTQILGQVLEQEQRALELVKFYATRLKAVQDKIEKAKLKKPKIYIEFGNKGPLEQSFTFGKDMWGALIEQAGGENIAKNAVQKWGIINPELVLAANPEVIIITGRESELAKNKEAMVMGFDIEQSEALRRLEGFKERKGWYNVKAVQDKRLFGVYHRASTSLADIAMVEFIAKILYPQLFDELDPLKTYLDFHQKYLLAVPNGAFIVRINDAR